MYFKGCNEQKWFSCQKSSALVVNSVFVAEFTDKNLDDYCISHTTLKAISTGLYLLQISVAPGLPIRKCSGKQTSLSIILGPLWDRAPVYGTQLPIAIAGEVDRQQLATWHPESRLTCCVITNLQKEFTVIIIDLFNPQRSVIINRQNVPSIYLEVQAKERHKIGMATAKWQKIDLKIGRFFHLSELPRFPSESLTWIFVWKWVLWLIA